MILLNKKKGVGMTNEEAIKNIKEHCYFANLIPRAKEALDMAIKALEQELCEDAISRKEAIDEVKRIKISLGGKDIFQNESKESIVKILDDLPSVTPQPKVGHWIENAPEYQNIDPPYICSECGNMHLRKTNYCDQCGCRMVEQQESEEA